MAKKTLINGSMLQHGSLREWRKANYGRQQDLADKLEEPRGTYQAWETGRAEIPYEKRAKIEALGFKGTWPEVGGQLTKADIEALEESVTGKFAAVREELAGMGEILKQVLERLQPSQGTGRGARS